VHQGCGRERGYLGKKEEREQCHDCTAIICSFYKGLPPLWMRQIPYTMMKFAAFERTVEFLYKHIIPIPRDQLGKPSQLVVTFAAGYIAGVLCTLVSHPADSIVSKLNSQAGSSILEATRQLGMSGKWMWQLP